MPNTPNQTPSTPNKKHVHKAKHQIRQKKHQIRQINTKYAKNTKYSKKYTKYAKKNTNYAKKQQICKKNTKYSKILQIFIYAVLSRKNFVPNSRTFWCTFYRPKKYGGVPKRTNIRYGYTLIGAACSSSENVQIFFRIFLKQ